MQAPLDPSENLPCLTYIRHPVERLVSFYYWVYDRNKLAAPLLQARTFALARMAIVAITPWGGGVRGGTCMHNAWQESQGMGFAQMSILVGS